MKPQINLLDDIAGSSGGLDAKRLLLLGIAGALLIILATLIQGSYVNMQKSALLDWQQKVSKSQQRLGEIQKQFPNISVEDQLIEQNDALKKEIQEQNSILALLDTENSLQTQGFYAYLKALADNARRGIWLTEIELSPGTASARLKGQSTDPELVPVYVEDLSESQFKGTRIGTFNLFKQEQGGQLYEFELNTKVRAAGDQGGDS